MDASTLMTVLDAIVSQTGVDLPTSAGAAAAAAISGKDIVKAGALIGAGICMGFGAIGPGVGEGYAAGRACEAIGRSPQDAGLLTRTMLIGQAVAESTGIYSLVVSLLMLFVVGG